MQLVGLNEMFIRGLPNNCCIREHWLNWCELEIDRWPSWIEYVISPHYFLHMSREDKRRRNKNRNSEEKFNHENGWHVKCGLWTIIQHKSDSHLNIWFIAINLFALWSYGFIHTSIIYMTFCVFFLYGMSHSRWDLL